MSSWLRRRGRGWLALALPAVLLRALIPVGFMPGAAGLQICHGGMPTTTAAVVHGQGGDDTSLPTPAREHARGCAFALASAGAAPPPVHGDLVTLLPAWVPVTLPAESPPAIFQLLRSQLPRGPPSFS